MTALKPVCVVIPVYKPTLTRGEEISLKRCVDILGHYPIFLVCPTTLDCTAYTAYCPQAQLVRFSPDYFSSIRGYNNLMLSSLFYEKFLDYEYLLIHQLDVYVFRDDLLLWCQKGYDYVGAPWLIKPPVTNPKAILDLNQLFVNRVGNGGFSLRKVRSHYVNVRRFKLLAYLTKIVFKNEDIFWSYVLANVNPRFTRPSVAEALTFAFEFAPRLAFEKNNRQLPFGVHAWEKHDKAFWRTYIPE